MSRRRFALLLTCFLGLCLFAFAVLLCERIRGQISLSSYRRSLLARGEKLGAQDFSLTVPKEANGAEAFTNAVAGMVSGNVVSMNYLSRMRLMDSGRALVSWREEEWVSDKKTYRWEDMQRELGTNAVVLGRIQTVLSAPQFYHGLDYLKGMELHLPHLAQVKSLSSWFAAASQLAIRQGRAREAREAIEAMSRLPRVMENDRLLISELVRIALARIARATIWEALQADVLTPDELLILQRTWEGLHFLENMEKSLEGERIYGDASLELVAASHEKTLGAFSTIDGLARMFSGTEGNPSNWKARFEDLPYGPQIADAIEQQIYARVWRFAWSHQLQLRNLAEGQRLIEIARAAVVSKSFAAIRGDVLTMEKESERVGVYDRLRCPFDTPFIQISKSVQKALEAETERSLVLCALAIKRHSLQQGRLPVSLDELVPAYMSSVPADYMDGKPMRYRVLGDGRFLLYSVGSDTVDQGGDPSRMDDQSSSSNPWSRKDLVWPTPALPEEVQTWRKSPK